LEDRGRRKRRRLVAAQVSFQLLSLESGDLQLVRRLPVRLRHQVGRRRGGVEGEDGETFGGAGRGGGGGPGREARGGGPRRGGSPRFGGRPERRRRNACSQCRLDGRLLGRLFRGVLFSNRRRRKSRGRRPLLLGERLRGLRRFPLLLPRSRGRGARGRGFLRMNEAERRQRRQQLENRELLGRSFR